ncbi:MFS transporter [Novosphingobium piscinae]|uniref:MFS transporter n=1 Tax=Novosphingobium piscinae TaxID=1507448 RepID=A0A7X1KNF5_9SPHN|nr:MFS transporter [Novosphingobium piscinae]MBC2667646.1 MFS transporter [Novosphingobium piscinae]
MTGPAIRGRTLAERLAGRFAEAPSARYPWLVVGLLWMVSFLNSADRAILNSVKPLLRDAFAISDVQLGLVDTVFFWTYAVCAFLFGRIGDSVRRRNMILFGLVFWSTATGLMPLATGFAMLLAMRTLVAVGESTYYPTATALISAWHPARQRSRALAIHQTAVFAGGGIGGWAAGRLADVHGWWMPFLVFSALGFVVFAVLIGTLRDDAPAAARPVLVRAGAAEAGGTDEPLRLILANPAALLLCAVFCLATAAYSAVLNWSNTYAHDVLGLNLAESALVGPVMITTAGFTAVLVGGWLADVLAARSALGRFTVLALGLAIAATFLLPFPWARSATMVGALLFATSFGKGLFDGCIYAAMHDVMPDAARATAAGLMTMMGFLGAGIATVALPAIATHTGLGAGFGMMAGLYLLAVLLLLAGRPLVRRVLLAGSAA